MELNDLIFLGATHLLPTESQLGSYGQRVTIPDVTDADIEVAVRLSKRVWEATVRLKRE